MSKPNIDIAARGASANKSCTYETKILKGTIPFSDQVTENNTKYVIKWDFDLDDNSVTIPEGCIIEFDGGTISNGTLVGNNTILVYIQNFDECVKNVRLEGTFRNNPRVGLFTENVYDDVLEETQRQFNARVQAALTEANRRAQAVIPLPDEEDLTTDGKHNIKLKNKAYAPAQFSGLGKTYLRKHIVEIALPFDGFVEDVTLESEGLTSAPVAIFFDSTNGIFVGIDNLLNPKYYGTWLDGSAYNTEGTLADDDEFKNTSADTYYKYDDGALVSISTPTTKNILTQEMLSQENTIYVIQYDYDLNGGTMGGISFTSSNVSSVKTPEKTELDAATAAYVEDPSAENLARKNNAQAAFEAIGSQEYYYWSEVHIEAGHVLYLSGRTVKLNNDKSSVESLYGNFIVAENNTTVYLGCLAGTYNYRYDWYVEIPNNCILEFEGGSLSNGTIVGNNTGVKAGLVKIFNTDIVLSGTWSAAEAYPEWFGAIGDCILSDSYEYVSGTDNYHAFVTALKFANVKLQKKIYYIDALLSLKPISGSVLCGNGATIKVKYNNIYAPIIEFKNVSQCIIENLNIVGWKQEGVEYTEWCHGVNVTSNSSEISINNVKCSYCRGDGFYINGKNITLNGCISDYNHRNGASLINCQNVSIENCEFEHTYGVDPQYGIDIEPNEGESAANITINNCNIHNNGVGGMQIRQVRGTSIVNNISITNCKILEPGSAFKIEDGEYITIDHCSIETYGHGIYMVTGVNNNISITNNTLLCTKPTPTAERGIDIEVETNDVVIYNNIIKGYYWNVSIQNVSKMLFGKNNVSYGYHNIIIWSGTDCTYIDNKQTNLGYKTDGNRYDGWTFGWGYQRNDTFTSRKDLDTLLYSSAGNTSGRPASARTGYLYFNTDTKCIEKYDGTSWVSEYRYGIGATADRPQLTSSDNQFEYFDTTLERTIHWNGTSWRDFDGIKNPIKRRFGNGEDIYQGGMDANQWGTIFYDGPHGKLAILSEIRDGRPVFKDAIGTPYSTSNKVKKGTTGGRPTMDSFEVGYEYYDTTLGKPIWWNGSNWVDATGATV